MRVAVVIPVYKTKLTNEEKLSFDQCLRVLDKHPIVLLAPEELSLEAYAPDYNGLSVIRMPKEHFSSVKAYSALCLLPQFYRAFEAYDFILIYQLDAFVFRDELLTWCDAGYDYIGAPWINVGWLDPRSPNLVGNGGLSLRKTKTMIAICERFAGDISRWTMNEDGFWAFFARERWPGYKLPTTEEALRFSFDRNPDQCFKLNGNKLPFGCHAWPGVDFWKDHIL